MGHSDTSTLGNVSTKGPSLLPDADTGEKWCDVGRHGDYMPRPAHTRPLVLLQDIWKIEASGSKESLFESKAVKMECFN